LCAAVAGVHPGFRRVRLGERMLRALDGRANPGGWSWLLIRSVGWFIWAMAVCRGGPVLGGFWRWSGARDPADGAVGSAMGGVGVVWWVLEGVVGMCFFGLGGLFV